MTFSRLSPLLVPLAMIAALASCSKGDGGASAATYTPPPAIGEVYTVFHYKTDVAASPQPTNVTVAWGGWHHVDVVAPPASPDAREGFVVRLHHKGPDSVTLTVTTDGAVVSGPMQGEPPAQWTKPGYQQIKW